MTDSSRGATPQEPSRMYRDLWLKYSGDHLGLCEEDEPHHAVILAEIAAHYEAKGRSSAASESTLKTAALEELEQATSLPSAEAGKTPRTDALHRSLEQNDDTIYADLGRMSAHASELERELTVTEGLLADRERVLKAIPECGAHGDQCVPHALEWIEQARSSAPSSEAVAINHDTLVRWMYLADQGESTKLAEELSAAAKSLRPAAGVALAERVTEVVRRAINDVWMRDFGAVWGHTQEDMYAGVKKAIHAELSACSATAFSREDAAKIVERKAKALAEEYCHGDSGPGGYTWSDKEAEWQVILLDELAEEFRRG